MSKSGDENEDELLEQEKHDVTEKPEELCGCRGSFCGASCSIRCRMFQSAATAKWAVILFCLGNMLQQTMINGLYGVSVSTLEKRFELKSTESGIIGSSCDFARVVGLIAVVFFPKNIDKPTWIGWGVAVIGIGGVLFTLPHFVAPEYSYIHEEITNYCGNVTDPDCTQSAIRNYRFWFMFSISLVGLGCCPLYTFGLTYLDESVGKKDSALYSAIYFAMGGLGPALGFVFGGLALELYTYIGVVPTTIDSRDELWVGAWWIGFLICGILGIIAAAPTLMLPKQLPGTEKHRKNRNVEAQKSHLKKKDNENSGDAHNSLTEFGLLMRNKPYIFMTLGMTMNCALIYGFNTFGAKYIQSVFGLTPFHSALVYGIAAIFASSGAQICSGAVIKKFNLSVTGILKFIIVGGILSAICSLGFIVHCDELEFAGGTVPYPNSTFTVSLDSSCNEGCGCTTDRYQPVCVEDVIYYSPCYAGCTAQINDTAFTNCSCVAAYNSSQPDDIVASSEFCNSKPCNMIIPFIFMVFLCFFTSVLTLAPSVQVTLRCVPFSSRDTALAFQAAMNRIAGIIPGRILVGLVLDAACVSWSTECGEQGSCKAYRRWEVARNNTVLLLAQTIACAVCYILVLVTYKPAGDEAEEQQEKVDSEKQATKSSQTDTNAVPT